MHRLLVVGILLVATAASADEGMWTFDNFPKGKLKEKYGVRVDDKWLEHVRLASVRLAGGCSGSFVSDSGLVMTNDHCARDCAQAQSTAAHDYIHNGYSAATAGEELKCSDTEINQLVETRDVTLRIQKATTGLEGAAYHRAYQSEIGAIEKACQSSDQLLCNVVSLYHGGQYQVYKYRRYEDVRLVFVPEDAIAEFGGDPDNFNFPRSDLDVAFFRVYEGGKALPSPDYFKWSATGAKAGEVTFVSGHPGGTDRQLTVAQLEYQRDVQMPDNLLVFAQLRGMLSQFGRESAEHQRISLTELVGLENGFKVLSNEFKALTGKSVMAKRQADEDALRAAIAKDPALVKKYGGAWEAIAKAIEAQKNIRDLLNNVEYGAPSQLFYIAKLLVRAADERPKANDERFHEFQDASLPSLEQQLFSAAPIYDDLEKLMVVFNLTHLREKLGPDHPFVKKMLGDASPEELAAQLVSGSKLKDVAVRKRLWDGGKKAIAASTDPYIVLARTIDADGRAVRRTFEDDIQPVIRKNSELIAQAKFALAGTSVYPDATFTLRLNYGVLEGWVEKGVAVNPFTTFASAFARATGRDPFMLPPSWLKAKSALDLTTPFNFTSNNDIVGGNSGSPVINANAEIVGLAFDGNIHSIGGNYGFDDSDNRMVAVHSQAIVTALRKIYHADRLVAELEPHR